MNLIIKGILGVLGFWLGLFILACGAIYYPFETIVSLLIFCSVLIFLLVYGECS